MQHQVGPKVEEGLFDRVRDLFHLDLTLMLFDTASTYLEGDAPEGLAEYGYSRDRRPGRRQMVLGLLLTREGIPVCHRVFPGNTVDAQAFQQVLQDLKNPLRDTAGGAGGGPRAGVPADPGPTGPVYGGLDYPPAAGPSDAFGYPRRCWPGPGATMRWLKTCG